MTPNQLIIFVRSNFSVGDSIPAAKKATNYTFAGIKKYESGTYPQHFGKEVFVIDTHTKQIKKANLFFELLSLLFIAFKEGKPVNNKTFHDILNVVAYENGERKFPGLTTLEPYYIAVVILIYKNMSAEKKQKASLNVAIKKEKEIIDSFNEAINESEKLSDDVRKKRLAKAAKKPTAITVTTITYQRNADVVVEVLRRANGVCESCIKKAPFLKRTNNQPYLEVHHIVKLSDDGNDTVENAEALCPNCHRQKHFGK